MIPGIALSELNPENLEKLKKLIEESKPEFEKLINALLESAGLTKSQDYVGGIPLLMLGYEYVYPIIKDLIVIEKLTISVLTAVYSFLTGSIKDIETIGKDIGKLFKL